MQLTDDMRRVVDEQRLAFVATVRPDGSPNVSPKGTTIVLDDHRLAFADIVSPGTVANLAVHPRVEVNVVDPIVRRGYRFSGPATVLRDGLEFEALLQRYRERGTDVARIRSIVVIEVEAAAELVSPAYDVGATEPEVAERWLAHHTDLHHRRSPGT